MQKQFLKTRSFAVAVMLLFACIDLRANNVMVTNVSVINQNTTQHSVQVQFDLYWENSWMFTNGPSNWDAAWVFVKFNVGDLNWRHAYVSTNSSDHQLASGAQCTVGLTGTNGMGVFIYRNAVGTGTNNWQQNKLLWYYGNQGISDNAQISADVEAVEMVYVPGGGFYAGDGNTNLAQFHQQGNTLPYFINGENALTLSPTITNSLDFYNTGQTTVSVNVQPPQIGAAITSNGIPIATFGPSQYPYPWTNVYTLNTYSAPLTVSNAFPKGYNAFYVMKYECTQDEYNDFAAKQAHQITSSGTTRAFYTNGYFQPAAMESYLDWAGLRPITEFEYEKACRGPAQPVAGEYAWGTVVIQNQHYGVTNINSSASAITSNYYTLGGNCWYFSTAQTNDSYPLRAGIFAMNSYGQGTSPRSQSGAGFYGVMELTGNAAELCVCAPNDGTNPSPFDGTPGSGGVAIPASWTNSFMIVRGDQASPTSSRASDRGAAGLSEVNFNLSVVYTNTFFNGSYYTTNVTTQFAGPEISSQFIGIRGGRTAH